MHLERQLAIQGTDLGRAPHIVKGVWLVRQDIVGEAHTRKLRRMLSIDPRPHLAGAGFQCDHGVHEEVERQQNIASNVPAYEERSEGTGADQIRLNGNQDIGGIQRAKRHQGKARPPVRHFDDIEHVID